MTEAPVRPAAPFVQPAPALPNRYRADATLRQAVERLLPPDSLPAASAELDALGELARSELAALGDRAEANPPRHVVYDAWGQRVDRIEVDPAWLRLVEVACERGLVATAYEDRYAAGARVVQTGLLQLFEPVSATAMCPIGMTDAAARALLNHDGELAQAYVPRLVARRDAWLSGQWMTEQAGGSDVGTNATVARPAGGGRWTLHGTKWFTSATTADIALVLARTEGAAAGSAGLSLFLLELRRPDGSWNGLRVRRLKDKLGTRALPTAEMDLDGAVARPVGGTGRGIHKVADMLNVARLGAASSSVAQVGHALTLARDYADLRVVFGKPLSEHAVHQRWIAGIAAAYEAMVALSFRAAQLVGAAERGGDGALARVVVPLAKLACARQAVWACSHLVESFGGAGYLEDTGLPRVLRDVHVHCIWEGTTSVMALDVVRALRNEASATAVFDDLERLVESSDHPAIGRVARAVLRARADLRRLVDGGADARRVAWGLARTYQAALLCEAGAWALDKRGDPRSAHAATVFSAEPLVAGAWEIGAEELASLAFPAREGHDR